MTETRGAGAPLRFWDYLYLNVNRLEDYWSRLDQGSVETIKEMTKLATEMGHHVDTAPNLNELPADLAKRQDELVREKTMTITAKHSFSKLYEQLEDHKVTLGDEATLDECPRGTIIDVTREFQASPVTQMLESLFELIEMMQGLNGVTDMKMDPETREAMTAISLLFRGEDAERRGTPLISEADSEPGLSILFVAEPQFVLVPRDELDGEMTLLGKVQKQIPPGSHLDLLDFLKVLPRALRRKGTTTGGMRDVIANMFSSWPNELGGAINPDALLLHGPAIVVSPLAVYN